MMLSWITIEAVAGIAAVLALFYSYLTWNHNYWKKRGVPYEKPKLFFGNYKEVFMVRKTVGEVIEDLYWKMDGHPFIGAFRFLSPVLVARDPDVIKKILVKDFNNFDENAFHVSKDLDPLLARNPFFMKGEAWRNTRYTLTPAFTASKLKPMFPLMKEVAQELVDYLENATAFSRPDGIEAKELASKFTINVVSTCAFGIAGDSFKSPNAEMLRMARSTFNVDFFTTSKFLINSIFPSLGHYLRVRLMPVSTSKYYFRIVREVMEYREKHNITRNDFLQLLMTLKYSSGTGKTASRHTAVESAYTETDMTGHAVTFMIEGFETSSITLSFLLYELAMNPNAQEKLRAEVDMSVQENNGVLIPEAVLGLPYLNMVFQETLRMHSSVLTLEKYCTSTYTLESSSGRDVTLEPGTVVLIPVKALHSDPKYFPDPHLFDPERFSEERKASINRFAYLPFGEGPRVCIGMKFAQAQVKIGAAMLVLNYEIRRTLRTPTTVVQDPNYFLAAAKGGLWLNFVKRS